MTTLSEKTSIRTTLTSFWQVIVAIVVCTFSSAVWLTNTMHGYQQALNEMTNANKADHMEITRLIQKADQEMALIKSKKIWTLQMVADLENARLFLTNHLSESQMNELVSYIYSKYQ